MSIHLCFSIRISNVGWVVDRCLMVFPTTIMLTTANSLSNMPLQTPVNANQKACALSSVSEWPAGKVRLLETLGIRIVHVFSLSACVVSI